MMTTSTPREILAASFGTSDGAANAAARVLGAYADKIANTAVLHVKADGTPHFIESKDWGAGRGALVGGAIGLIGGPLTALAGSGIGVLASRLRDKGFPNAQLARLGQTLGADDSVVIFELARDATPAVRPMLDALAPREVVVASVDDNVAALFQDAHAAS